MTQSQNMSRVDHDNSRIIDDFTTVAFSSLQWYAIWNSGYCLRSTCIYIFLS